MDKYDVSCGCGGEETMVEIVKIPQRKSLAMAYVPYQAWDKVYPADVAFSRGTIFEELDLPFLGEEVCPNA